MMKSTLIWIFATLIVTVVRADVTVTSFAVPAGAHPHDVAPAADGAVWYTAQHQEALGRLDPATGETRHVSPWAMGRDPMASLSAPPVQPGSLTVASTQSCASMPAP